MSCKFEETNNLHTIIVITRLQYYGVRYIGCSWIESYLQNRKTVCRFNATGAECKDNSCVVMQLDPNVKTIPV